MNSVYFGGGGTTMGITMGPQPTLQKTLEKLFSEHYLARNQNHVIIVRLL